MAKTILLVEDSQDDEFLCKEVLKKVVFNSVMTVRDGSQAIAYLNGQGKFADRQRYPLPDVVLLDLQMPVLDGFQVLEWFKTQPDLNKMLVVVLSQFGQTRDIEKAYALGAHSFLTKPLKHEDVVHLTQHFKDYWHEVP